MFCGSLVICEIFLTISFFWVGGKCLLYVNVEPPIPNIYNNHQTMLLAILHNITNEEVWHFQSNNDWPSYLVGDLWPEDVDDFICSYIVRSPRYDQQWVCVVQHHNKHVYSWSNVWTWVCNVYFALTMCIWICPIRADNHPFFYPINFK
jgi:hypothetical protein